MVPFLRLLLAHAEWADAVFFHAWGKSPARDHEELRSRVAHIHSVQDGFLSILRGEPPGMPPGRPPPPFEDLKARADLRRLPAGQGGQGLPPAAGGGALDTLVRVIAFELATGIRSPAAFRPAAREPLPARRQIRPAQVIDLRSGGPTGPPLR
jgi:hypothetical protein